MHEGSLTIANHASRASDDCCSAKGETIAALGRKVEQSRVLVVVMSSTFECSRNDVASNVGVLVAAGLVAASGSARPDIAVGGLIALIVLRSAWRVLGTAIPAWHAARPVPPAVRR